LATDTGGDGTGCDNMTAIIVRINGTVGSAGIEIKSSEAEPEEKTVEGLGGEEAGGCKGESGDCSSALTTATTLENRKVDCQGSSTVVLMSSSKRPYNGSPSPTLPESPPEESKRLKLDVDGGPI